MEKFTAFLDTIPLVSVAIITGILIIAGIGIILYDHFNKDTSE